jgi:hypothetical protein
VPAAIKKAIELERAQSGGGWTVATLRLHLLALIEYLAGVCEERFDSQSKVGEHARDELSRRIDSLSVKLDHLSSRLDRMEGSGSGLKAGWGYLAGGVGLLVGLVTAVIEIISHLH